MGETAENRIEPLAPSSASSAVPAGRTGNPEVDILQILCEFDAGLEGLKTIYERRKALETALVEKQSQLSDREKELGARRSELEVAGADLERQREEIAKAQAETTSTREEIEARQKALEDRRQEIEAEKLRIDTERSSVEDARRQWLEESARREGEIQGERERLREQLVAAEKDRASLASEREGVAGLREALEAKQRELEESASAIEAGRRDFEQRLADVTSREEGLASRAKDLDTQARAIDEQREELESIKHALAQRESELEAKAGEVEAARTKAAELAQRCTAERDQAVNELARVKSEFDRTRLELEAKGRGAKAMEPVLEALKTSLLEAEGRLAEAITDAEIRSQQGSELADRLRVVIDEYERLWLLELEHSAQLTVSLEAARAQPTSEASAAPAPIANDSSAEEIAELEKIIEALKDRLRKEMHTREEAQQIAEAAAQDLSAAGEALKAAEQRADEADRIVVRLREELARARTRQPGAAVDETTVQRLARRRERLRKYRAAVRDQADKVRKASEIVKKRYDQAEHVLAHRAELAAIRERVIEAERRNQSVGATTRVAQIGFFSVAIVAILGGLSWAVSRQVAPAAFMAEATLSADGRGRELSPAELDEWQKFHQNVLKDPLFHEAAAERFKRLGLLQFGTPVAVREVIDGSLTADDSRAGELRLRMVGQGADRTERVMEAFTSVFASYSNAAQQKRIDGSATKVFKPASVSEEPIDNTRTYYALGIMGGGLLVVVAAAFALWTRLARAKTSFEMDQQVAAALVGTQWADLPKMDSPKSESKKSEPKKSEGRKGKEAPQQNAEDAEAAKALEDAKKNTKSPRGAKGEGKKAA